MAKVDRLIIYIGKDKIAGVAVDLGKRAIVGSMELGWDDKTLDIALGKIIEKFKQKKIRILLDDKFSYVLRIKIPMNVKESDERGFISDQITQSIPEFLANDDWDYKEINFNISSNVTLEGKEKEAIVFSPVKYLFKLVSETVAKLDLEVEAVEPVEIALTRNTNPILGLALKDDVIGKDKDVLNINIDPDKKDKEFKDIIKEEKVSDIESKDNSNDPIVETDNIIKAGKNKTTFVLAVILIFVMLIAGLFYLFVYKKSEKSEVITIDTLITTPTVIPTINPSPTEEIITDNSIYKVEVLNGTGIPGEAQNAVKLLEEIGFKDLETGNALSYDYKKTVINTKEGVGISTINDILNALDQEYDLATESGILTSSDYDIQIAVGVRD